MKNNVIALNSEIYSARYSKLNEEQREIGSFYTGEKLKSFIGN